MRVRTGWWDFTTLDERLLQEAGALSAQDLLNLSRPGFTVRLFRRPALKIVY